MGQGGTRRFFRPPLWASPHVGTHSNPQVGQAKDQVNIALPLLLRDRLAALRWHPRMAMHEVIEEALDFWEDRGGWAPLVKAPVDGRS